MATQTNEVVTGLAGNRREMTAVTVYTTGPSCIQCKLTCQVLESVQIPFTVIDITEDAYAHLRDWLTDDLGYTQAPVVIVDDEPENHWSGFKPDLIKGLAVAQAHKEEVDDLDQPAHPGRDPRGSRRPDPYRVADPRRHGERGGLSGP